MNKPALAVVLSLAFVPSLSHAAPALVQIDVGGCTMADGDGNTGIFFPIPDAKHKVATQSPGGNLILTCEVDAVPNHSGHAVLYNFANTDGSECRISDPLLGGQPQITTRWQEVVSAGGQANSGNAILSCTYHLP